MTVATLHRAAPDTVAPSSAVETVWLGDWELCQQVASGPTANLYRARHADQASSAGSYAIKVLRPECESQPELVEMFQREAAASAQVRHAHLVPLLGQQLQSSPYYLVFPWLEGETLERKLRAGRLSTINALWYARQVAQALTALHGAGWLHGDVNAANVMIASNGHATLMDLGFDSQIDKSAAGDDRPITGTLAYLAPEVAIPGRTVDGRSDLYSLGVLMYEMLAGRRPFEASSQAELIEQHRCTRPRHLRTYAPHLPRETGEFVEQLIAKEPLRRPANAQEVVDRLVELEIAQFSEREHSFAAR